MRRKTKQLSVIDSEYEPSDKSTGCPRSCCCMKYSGSSSIAQIVRAMFETVNPHKYPHVGRAIDTKSAIVLTDHGKKELIPGLRKNLKKKIINSWIGKLLPFDLMLSLLFIFTSFKNKGTVFVTFGNSRTGYLLMIFQLLLSIIRKPKIHVLFDCLWEKKDSMIGRLLSNIRAFLVRNTIFKCIVYGNADIKQFSANLRIPESKQVFIHYHHTLSAFDSEIKNGDYVFCGGNAGRVYAPLFKICSELQIPLKVASTDDEAHKLALTYQNADVKSTTSNEYLQMMANSMFVVLPFGNDATRTFGHQTFINAMLMGKPLVIYNKRMADGYIIDGENGISVEYGDEERLKEVISNLYLSPDLRKRLGENARSWVLCNNLCSIEWALKVYEIALKGYYHPESIY